MCVFTWIQIIIELYCVSYSILVAVQLPQFLYFIEYVPYHPCLCIIPLPGVTVIQPTNICSHLIKSNCSSIFVVFFGGGFTCSEPDLIFDMFMHFASYLVNLFYLFDALCGLPGKFCKLPGEFYELPYLVQNMGSCSYIADVHDVHGSHISIIQLQNYLCGYKFLAGYCFYG